MTFSEYTQEGPTVTLRDELGRQLPCQVEQSMELEGHTYALLLPIDTPVEVFTWVEDDSGETEELVDVEEEKIDALFPTAQAVLSEQELTLQRSAITLTVAGELPEPEEEDCFTLEIEDATDEDGNEASEEFQILATFFHEGVEYTVCTPMDPLLIFAQIEENGEATVVPPEDFERLRPQLEETLFDILD